MTVYYSQGGKKYHADPNCRAWESGQGRWDWEPPEGHPDEGPWHGGYGVRRVSERFAYSKAGKRPCLVCLPGRRIPFPATSNHGHQPAEWFARGQLVDVVCVRCRITHWRDVWEVDGDVIRASGISMVKWPCASAIVLGVAEQSVYAELAAA